MLNCLPGLVSVPVLKEFCLCLPARQHVRQRTSVQYTCEILRTNRCITNHRAVSRFEQRQLVAGFLGLQEDPKALMTLKMGLLAWIPVGRNVDREVNG